MSRAFRFNGKPSACYRVFFAVKINQLTSDCKIEDVGGNYGPKCVFDDWDSVLKTNY